MKRPSRAFTLVEAVVAMGILALVLLGILAAQISGDQVRSSLRQREHLNRALHDYVTDLRERSTVTAVVALVGASPNWIELGPQAGHTTDANQELLNGMIVTASGVTILTESEAATRFGTSFDLDRDGLKDQAGTDPANYDAVVPLRFWVTYYDSNATRGEVPPLASQRTAEFFTIVYPAGGS